MATIYLTEDNLSMMASRKRDLDGLPQTVYSAIANNRTSIGDNPAIPGGSKFLIDMVYATYKDVIDNLDNNKIKESDGIREELSELMMKCMEMERPIREQLQKVCENAITKMLAVPPETISLTLSLVDSVDANMNIVPEKTEDTNYSFSSVRPEEISGDEVLKRRIINSLIQGASHASTGMRELYFEDINKLNKDLVPMYDKILAIVDYLDFTIDNTYSDKEIDLNGYVGVRLGRNGKRTIIEAQAKLFPFLLQEAVRGFFELFSVHGLPENDDEAKSLIKRTDYLVAEQWDKRIGIGLWDKIKKGVESSDMYPYFFSSICCIPVKSFSETISLILSGSSEGKKYVNDIVAKIKKDNEYKQFKKDLQLKNVNFSLLYDGEISSNELAESSVVDGLISLARK